MVVTNYTMGAASLFKIHPFRSGIVRLKNILFENIGVTSGEPIIDVGVSYDADISNITFINAYKVNPRDEDPILISFGFATLNKTAVYTMNDIIVLNSSIPLVSMTQRSDEVNSGIAINMSRIKLKNSYFEVRQSLIEFRNFLSYSTLAIALSEFEFSDIEFKTVGDILSLRQQTLAPVTISNSTFTNLKGGRIFVDPLNKQQNELKTRVVMDNVTVNNIYQTDSAFIMAQAQSQVNITNSLFTNIHNDFKGSVISALDVGTKVFVESTIFANNSASYGGAFYFSDQSLLYCKNCSIHNNFALQSGVID